jgi:large subunit ribosomal protein L28e
MLIWGCNRTYASVASAVGKNSYRSDLNQNAVQRASAVKDSQRTKKDTPARKPRGAKAKITAEDLPVA